MPSVETHNNITLHLTADELGAVRERVQSLAPNSELAAVLTEAQPAEHPRVNPTFVVQPDENGNDTMVQTGTVTYSYAITLPPYDQVLAASALRHEGYNEAADDVSNEIA